MQTRKRREEFVRQLTSVVWGLMSPTKRRMLPVSLLGAEDSALSVGALGSSCSALSGPRDESAIESVSAFTSSDDMGPAHAGKQGEQ